jgi:hypothetical protein
MILINNMKNEKEQSLEKGIYENEKDSRVLLDKQSSVEYSSNNRSEQTFGSLIFIKNSSLEFLKRKKNEVTSSLNMNNILGESISLDFKKFIPNNGLKKEFPEILSDNNKTLTSSKFQHKLQENLEFNFGIYISLPQKKLLYQNNESHYVDFSFFKNKKNFEINPLSNFKAKKDIINIKKEKQKFNFNSYYKKKYNYFIDLSKSVGINNDNSQISSSKNSEYCEDNIKSLNYTFEIKNLINLNSSHIKEDELSKKLKIENTKNANDFIFDSELEKSKESFSVEDMSDECSEYEVNEELLKKIEENKFFEESGTEIIFNQNFYKPKEIEIDNDIKSIYHSVQTENEHPFNQSVVSETDFYANLSYSEITRKRKLQRKKNNAFSDPLHYNTEYLLKQYPHLYKETVPSKKDEKLDNLEKSFEKVIKLENGFNQKKLEIDQKKDHQNPNNIIIQYLGSETEFQVLSEKLFSLKNKKLAKYIFQSLRSIDYFPKYNFKNDNQVDIY